MILFSSASSFAGSTPYATGGDVTTNGEYFLHSFTNSGATSFISHATIQCEYLIRGGGGGGAAGLDGIRYSGGGGGGESSTGTTLVVVGSNDIVVGTGGVGRASYTGGPGWNGGYSAAFGITALGGFGAPGTTNGGTSPGGAAQTNAGAGGEGAADGGDGGNGTTSWVGGVSFVGSGGGGGSRCGVGKDGGGNGGCYSQPSLATSGTPNTGGGGGGGDPVGESYGGSGAEGLVVVAYKAPLASSKPISAYRTVHNLITGSRQ